jgi:hypothetical protein
MLQYYCLIVWGILKLYLDDVDIIYTDISQNKALAVG